MTRGTEDHERVLGLVADGLSIAEVVRQSGVPRSTVNTWLRDGVKLPRPHQCWRCDLTKPVPAASYVYLLGAYLGDGHIVRCPRDVFRLTLVQDANYIRLIGTWADAMEAVLPNDVTFVDGRASG